MKRSAYWVFLGMMVLVLSGCRPSGKRSEHAAQPDRIILQTDWFPQPEHGGFYQAVARGFYREAGLSVEILPGGPNAMSIQKVLTGRAHFAMNRADAICRFAHRDIPVQMVMATLQHDPQGILLHAGNPVTQFSQLDGRRVMAVPGLAWIDWVEAKYGIKMDIIPHDFGLERFLRDPDFIQQCLVTNEPYYARLAGAEPRVLLLRESGFDPYHGIFCQKSFADRHPDLVRRFIEASIRGWRDFILNDPSPALELIASLNPKMSPEFMEFCYGALRSEHLVTGNEQGGSRVGELDPGRLDRLENEMRALGLLPEDEGSRFPWYRTDLLPRPLDEPGSVHP